MASDLIKINQADPYGAPGARELVNLKGLTRQVYETALRVRGTMRHLFDDQANPIVWTTFEAYYGLPSGTGATVFGLVDGQILAMEGSQQNPNGRDLTERLG